MSLKRRQAIASPQVSGWGRVPEQACCGQNKTGTWPSLAGEAVGLSVVAVLRTLWSSNAGKTEKDHLACGLNSCANYGLLGALMKLKPQAFLKDGGFVLDALDPRALLASFLEAMDAGLAGRTGGLPMLPAYLSPADRIPPDKPVLAIDAGGTHLRVAVVVFNQAGKPEISRFARHAMPAAGAAEPLDADSFFRQLAEQVQPVADAADRIGFCFSYATEMAPHGDGRLKHWSKEINAPEVKGRFIGRELLKRLDGRGASGHRLVLLNDTVACLLAGVAVGAQRRCSRTVGFILGTGTNVAYLEKNRHVAGAAGREPEGLQAINVESGMFDGVPASRFDVALDADSSDPGAYRMEKMMSGAYMGCLGLCILRHAADAGLFSAGAADLFRGWTTLSTKTMDDFLANPFVDNAFASPAITLADRRTALQLCRPVVARAALLAAVTIAAAVIKSDAGRDALFPVCVNIDGSTFYLTWRLAERVQAHLQCLLEPRGIDIYPARTPDAPLIGAAVAGLTH